MPSLQLDLTVDLTAHQKRVLSSELTAEYSRIMASDPKLMTVVIRALPEGSVWHGTEQGLVPGALIMCDIRAGRNRSTRHQLAARLIELVAEHAHIAALDVKVEFTQHTGDEMFHPFLGGFNRDWDLTERAGSPHGAEDRSVPPGSPTDR